MCIFLCDAPEVMREGFGGRGRLQIRWQPRSAVTRHTWAQRAPVCSGDSSPCSHSLSLSPGWPSRYPLFALLTPSPLMHTLHHWFTDHAPRRMHLIWFKVVSFESIDLIKCNFWVFAKDFSHLLLWPRARLCHSISFYVVKWVIASAYLCLHVAFLGHSIFILPI